ncbi:zinc transporter, ZIP family [Paenibacillus sp. 1_12]|uniref:ZIP family metal transporter n=1 Tax=Paenibacillus sp. 1_12 TaxID=1566278 RepID=UPI0008ECBA20|nr:ZIP family metal transporter [Paenibacillus sp. 1_12]SFL54930.1 zinc transporter, ZIP family [Paenibacillus sp. 1_12]
MNEMMIGGFLSAVSTGIGALPVLLFKKLSHRHMDILLALTAGIMVAASVYGLMPTALKLSNLFVLCCGVLLGVASLSVLEEYLPHVDIEHSKSGVIHLLDSKSFLLVVAMSLHNLPEGLSIGVSYASQVEGLGNVVALSIGLQNAPEGLLIALFLTNQGLRRLTAIGLAVFTGSIEWFACILGSHLTSSFSKLIPYGLAFAAGAMLFIVYKELIPETHGHGHEKAATFSFIVGLLMMVCLLVWFG